jgi:acyl-CoA thioesterase
MDFTERLGYRTIRREDGECEMELDLEEIHMSVANRAHGGVLFAMLDSAMGRAVLSTLPERRGCATIECRINYFRPVQSGRLFAIGKVLNTTRNTAYAEGSIVDSDDKLVARASATFILTETLVQSERERV